MSDDLDLFGSSDASDEAEDEGGVVKWRTENDALRIFATSKAKTQSGGHIKPFHHYVACRLVVEGGFHPDDITPRPPFDAKFRKKENLLTYAPQMARGGEASILGGLKTKKVDVVVNKRGIGPVLGVSCKGMTGALRNMTNRMEESFGECTNLHITYPALVFGYMFLLRATPILREAAEVAAGIELAQESVATRANDVVIDATGNPVATVLRFDYAMSGMTGRRSIRNDVSRYEAVTLALVTVDNQPGQVLPDFPLAGSPIRIERFFPTLYTRYDERFVFSAPDLEKVTRRLEWSPASPAFATGGIAEKLDYDPRLA